jgi:hypothetical protein
MRTLMGTHGRIRVARDAWLVEIPDSLLNSWMQSSDCLNYADKIYLFLVSPDYGSRG